MSIFEKHVFVCTSGKTCPGQGSEAVLDALRQEIKERGLKKSIRINKSGCLDQCGAGPIMVTYPEGTWYCQVSAHDSKEIVEKHLIGNHPIKRLLYSPKK